MLRVGNKIYLSKGDSFDYTLDPNLSGSGFYVSVDGDGDETTFVKTTGLGNGDPYEVYVKKGSQVRGVPPTDEFMRNNGADPLTQEQKDNISNAVLAINSSGEKVPLGNWAAA